MGSRLAELREIADGVNDEAFSYIYKPVNAAELRFAQTFNPKRVRALLDVAEAAQKARECRHNDQYGGPCSSCFRALTSALDRMDMVPNVHTREEK